MLKRPALMDSISANLLNYLKIIAADLTLPQKKFLKDSVIGLIRCGKPIVCQIARHLPNQQTSFLSRLDRLDAQLTNYNNNFTDKINKQLPNLWLPLIKDDTPIILDLSDIAKPLAKKMDYLAVVRDGSNGKLINGYWLVEMYASVNHKNPLPILLQPFSHRQPFNPGQNPVVLNAVHKIFELTNKRGILTADRGFDSRIMFDDWMDNNIRFVVRLKGNRYLTILYGGIEKTVIYADDLADRTKTPINFHKVVRRRGRLTRRVCQIGWVKVGLPNRKDELTMIVSRLSGYNKPMMLLTNVAVKTAADAEHVFGLYIRRWECEEGMRFLKSQVNLEKIRAFSWSAICRLVLLCQVVMSYLGWVVQVHPQICEQLVRLGQPLAEKVLFLPYRLFGGLTEAINYCCWLRKDLLRVKLWKNPEV
jgi:hypothetical protein